MITTTTPRIRDRFGAVADDISGLLTEIEALELEPLRDRWRRYYGPPPKLRSVTLLRLALAWRLQADALGGLPCEVARKLDGRGRIAIEGRDLGIGARLHREWQGRMIEVVVEEDGFRWENTLYPSLSAAATAIAGSRWNGPRFFGLRDKDR